MADVITQKRINELGVYTQEASGHPDYKDPTTVWVALDHVDWTESKKFSLSQFIVANHLEAANLSTSTIAVDAPFGSNFSTATYYLNIQCYKETILDLGGSPVTIRTDVPYHSLVKEVGKFSIVVSETTDVVISYFAFE